MTEIIADEGHAVIAPSSLDRTVHCPGWLKNATAVPKLPDGEEAAEGEAAHWVALVMALAAVPGNGEMPAVGSKAPNGVLVTDEMIDGGFTYVEALEGLPGKMEERVDITRIHPTECWGRPDRFTWTPNTRTLRVFDYKFGFEYIEVFENWQLVAYAIGILEKLGLHDHLDNIILELVIVQPRLPHQDGPIRMWTVAASKVRAMVNIANQAAHEALGPNPSTKTGPHCLHCPARVSCVTLQQTTANVMDFAGHADPMLQTPGDIGRELRLIMAARNRLKARQTGLEAQAEALLRAGKMVPFFMMEPAQARLAWHDDVQPAEVEAMVQMLAPGKSALKPPALKTPTQVIKGRILDATVMSAYSSRPTGAMKMVPDSTTKSSKVFQK
jgi:hypothetical protein